MKKLLILLPILVMVGCASTNNPNAPAPTITKVAAGNLEVKQMDRKEVIQAARECVNSRMKPVIQSVPQPTDHGTILIPIAVNCEVYGPTFQ